MSVLLLRLAAPMQSWGTSSRFARRNTDRTPSKSGIVGMLAAAAGRRRTDSVEDLCGLRFGVRVEQPGQLERDFQTARPVDGSAPLPLSYRFYLSDAVFLAAVEGDPAMVGGLRDMLRAPVFPLYLGRRSCPPAGKLIVGIREGTTEEVLGNEPWQASPGVQARHPKPTVSLETVIDCEPGATNSELVHDEPVSFDPRHRQHGWRSILRGHAPNVPNPRYRPATAPVRAVPDPHDPMALLTEGAP
ncbi:type I-E CRISPR-associated protein Cas5/CasD [Amycolatopsis antarctica]|uniref:Type I-E CRISPR-associated protein Cas5/CasD n=1 Tax=Amycolatopsis antarctica TaxID=1854586 RepID=A0A263CYN0_9PSEU|nr:type I-E CRISPR-associated protein Cas5/CasD [Amycolatopsis antarctica]OZM71263.1 type I-E CRISPR-associated protein Cas5/CasD [Amycolatopsis antarctica]